MKRVVLSVLAGTLVLGIMVASPLQHNVLARESTNEIVFEKEQVATDVFKEEVIQDGKKITFERFEDKDGVVHSKVIEGQKETNITFDPKTNELLIDGVKREISIKPSKATLLASYSSQSVSIPSGGKFIGSFETDYDVNQVGLSVAAGTLSSLTRLPYSAAYAALASISAFSATAYITYDQYRYPKKCEQYRYFNHVKVYKNADRTKLASESGSGMFFDGKPTPVSCTP
ncbi:MULTISPECIES: hypothetical protein [Brevibacillus]|uniref:hypothetical protein n=1 Tax=Brevibacillus TaxID=55080 RepID=UPI000B9B01AC|nr:MULTISPECIES: hypothetical protein [Brevibacillus]MCG7318699.1 hypothetical protein [Brevibacillus laterosporus]RFB34039.1 hypothetical protein DZB91_12355 [Brevibacillus sp. VP]